MTEPTIDERIEALRKRIDGIAGYDSDPLGQEAIEALAIIDELKDDLRFYQEEDRCVSWRMERIAKLEAENARLKDLIPSVVLKAKDSWIRGKG